MQTPPVNEKLGRSDGRRADTMALVPLVTAAHASLTPQQWIDGVGVGINLGNVLEAPREGAWAPPAQERYFDDYVKAGFKTVRIPVRWDLHAGESPPYRIRGPFITRVEQIVDWSLARGLRTVLNSHHDDWLDGAADEAAFEAQLKRFTAIWQQVSARFARKGANLAFEVYNEPHLQMNATWLNRMNAAVLPVMRRHNPTRNVLLGGLQYMNPNWIIANPDALVFPEGDAHLMLEVHSYDPYDFCGSNKAQPLAPVWDASAVDGWVAGLSDWTASRNVSIMLGEFGCNRTQHNASGRLEWYTHVRTKVGRQGWGMATWDDGFQFSIYNRTTGTFDSKVLAALGLLDADYSYSYSS